MREIPFYLFVLMALLIALAYYSGLKTDAGAVQGLLVSVGQAFTGRNSSGNFAAYPGGGPK